MNWKLRLATMNDVSALQKLIPRSVRYLQKDYYSNQQIEGALGVVFGVDSQLIKDGTYFVVEVLVLLDAVDGVSVSCFMVATNSIL